MLEHISNSIPPYYRHAAGIRPQPSRKPLAPFGKQLAQALATGMRPSRDVRINMAANPWERTRQDNRGARIALALPDDQAPEHFSWPVAGCTCLLVELSPQGAERLQRTALALLDAGARRVRVIHPTGRLSVFGVGDQE